MKTLKIYSPECYFKNPETGELGWSIHFPAVKAYNKSDAARYIRKMPNFDCFISPYWEKFNHPVKEPKMLIPIKLRNEDPEKTNKFIENNRNWNVETQSYKDPEAEKGNIPLSDCELYQRGKYIILEHNKIIHYWEMANTDYPFFQIAIKYLQLQNPKKWKTIDKLINFRDAIRQIGVNGGCDYLEDLLDENLMTLEKYNHFMAIARAQDLQHHGSHTF